MRFQPEDISTIVCSEGFLAMLAVALSRAEARPGAPSERRKSRSMQAQTYGRYSPARAFLVPTAYSHGSQFGSAVARSSSSKYFLISS